MLLSNFRAVNNWFYENFMILNSGKFHFMSIGNDTRDEDVFYYENLTLKNDNEEDILGVTIDRKLTFYRHIKKMCRKADQKLSVLLRLSLHTSIPIKGNQYTLPWSNLN